MDPMAPLAPENPGGGNTKSPPAKQKPVRVSGAKFWTFTWNNYPENWLALLAPSLEGAEWIAGYEIGESGTPHSQGYGGFPVKVRPIGYRGAPKEIHWGDENGKPAKGTRQHNVTYCSKEGKPAGGTLRIPRPLVKMTYDLLRPWQKKIADEFVEPEDPLFGRPIHWYWEEPGGVGKSVLCTYFVDNCNCIILSGGAADMKFGVTSYCAKHGEGPDLIVMDIPRVQDNISIKGIEECKNGCFFSSKYESSMVRYNRPHVVVFANKPPDVTDMSMDRWKIVELKNLK